MNGIEFCNSISDLGYLVHAKVSYEVTRIAYYLSQPIDIFIFFIMELTNYQLSCKTGFFTEIENNDSKGGFREC